MQGKACCKEWPTRLDDWTLPPHQRTAYKTSFYPAWCHWGDVVSAKVFELPARVRCDRAARELREGVIGVLKEIHRHGGDAAFHRAARDLVASVAATVAHVEGRQHMLDVLGLIDRATEA